MAPCGRPRPPRQPGRPRGKAARGHPGCDLPGRSRGSYPRCGPDPQRPQGTLPRIEQDAAGGVGACCFPRLGFPPLEPPFPRRPLSKKEIRQGGKPIRGDTARLSFVYVSPPCTVPAFRICRRRQSRNTFTAWVAATTPPLCQSPQPPRESGHTGRTTCSLLSARLPALGGRVGPSAGLLRRARPRPLHGVRSRGLHQLTVPAHRPGDPVELRARRLHRLRNRAPSAAPGERPEPSTSAARHDRRALSPSRTSAPFVCRCRLSPPSDQAHHHPEAVAYGAPCLRLGKLRAARIAAIIPAAGPDPGETPESAHLGRSVEKRGRRIAHTGFEQGNPCPDIRLRGAFGGTSLGNLCRRGGNHGLNE